VSELKACPMCGGQAEIWTQKSFGMPLIRCECGLSLSGEMNCFLRDDIKELEDAWNNRVAPAKDAEVEKRAILAVKDIVSDMCNGSGGDRWYESCDRGIRREIRDAWEAIIIRRLTDSKEVDSE